MSLKFKRNLPILFALTVFVAVLAFFLGDQPVIAYTVRVDAPAGAQVAALSSDLAASVSLPKELTAESGNTAPALYTNGADSLPGE